MTTPPERIEDISRKFNNKLALQLTPSNDTITAVRTARKLFEEYLITHHQQLQKAREELIQEIYDEFNWLNTNNAIPDSEIGKGDLHWEMLQKISSDTRRELQARLIKVATEHNVTLNAYHHQSELDQPNK